MNKLKKLYYKGKPTHYEQWERIQVSKYYKFAVRIQVLFEEEQNPQQMKLILFLTVQ